ncbi:hypothetical protein [uncultured Mediterranea sp.]|uniref:hypothetical protein n=1 Tax=uncultured Mediterranea sp. TaxID=1926662 RepID=UPI002803A80D|nr:hypothetical protein [uncultured Mediterranea sp.]
MKGFQPHRHAPSELFSVAKIEGKTGKNWENDGKNVSLPHIIQSHKEKQQYGEKV